MSDHAARGVMIEEIRAEFQGAAQPILALLEVEQQLEAGRAHWDIERARREVGQIDLTQRIIEKRQHRLEDRRARQVSLGNQILDQLLERHVLMRVCLDAALPDLTQHLLEAEGCPTRSTLSASVFTKKPIRPSISGSLRFAVGKPTTMSSCPECRASRTWNAAMSVMNSVACCWCPMPRSFPRARPGPSPARLTRDT